MVPHAVRDLGAVAAREAGPGEDRYRAAILLRPRQLPFQKGAENRCLSLLVTALVAQEGRRITTVKINLRIAPSLEYIVGPANGRGAA